MASEMSLGLKAAKYGVAAVIVAGLIVFASFLYLGGSIQLPGSTVQGSTSKLEIQLTDPPQVPDYTSSLNLTYTSLALLVGEPSGHPGELNTTTVTMTPSGGSATLDLLKLQNVSETLGTVTLPNDSVIYSATFTVSSVKVDVNGTTSAVSLAGGGSTLTVTIANPQGLSGTNVALLQLNPVVVQTPTGYELIPSSVGVIRHSQGVGEDQVGSEHQLTENDTEALDNAHGNVTASLTAFSVSGNSTTITVEVKNTGNGSVVLNAIGVHGNFTALSSCDNGSSHGNSSEHNATTAKCQPKDHPAEVVFVPVNSTISGTACANLTMQLVNGDPSYHEAGGLTLAKGQCVHLTFMGMVSFGESNETLVPSTTAGQVYIVHVIASNGANTDLACTLPAGPTSCVVEHQED